LAELAGKELSTLGEVQATLSTGLAAVAKAEARRALEVLMLVLVVELMLQEIQALML
jgi:hypothetical protein